jgi:hypothetical protein
VAAMMCLRSCSTCWQVCVVPKLLSWCLPGTGAVAQQMPAIMMAAAAAATLTPCILFKQE